MLNPNKNRLNYGKIVSPPKGYQLDFAIGTTYSLNLDSLIDLSLSLNLSQGTDSSLVNDPVILLDCLRNATDKVALFCENGKIKLDRKPRLFHTLLEYMIFQVKNETMIGGNHASFHPKFWLLRFVGEENKIKYKLIVLSRNLTYDRSWDISFTMFGQKTDEETVDKNQPIIKFFEYLMEGSTHEPLNDFKIKKIKKIIDDLRQVKFELDSDIFEDYEFFVNGIENQDGIQESPLFKEKWNQLFIMSPFLSKKVIKGFNERCNDNSKAILISRRASLGLLKSMDCDNFEVYSLKDEIINGESIISDGESYKHLQDIHAKMYFIEYNENSELYLGSLNASEHALYGNIEFMVKLTVKKDKFDIKQLIDDVFNGKLEDENNIFEKIENVDEIPKPKDDEKDDLFNDISRLNFEGEIITNDDSYNIELTVVNYDKIDFKGKIVQIKPLLLDNYILFSKNMKFENISKINLSEFFTLKIENKEVVIKIQLEGMPEDRKEYIISNLIESKTDFIRYVSILLRDKRKSNFNRSDGVVPIDRRFKTKGVVLWPELYEKMLKAFLEDPNKILGLDFLIKHVNDEYIPDEFVEMYNTFLKVHDKYGG